MSALAREITVRSTVKTSEGEYLITSVSWETTGNVHAIGFMTERDGSFRYGCFSTNGNTGPYARVYLNFTTDVAGDAMRNYLVVSGMCIQTADRDIIPAF